MLKSITTAIARSFARNKLFTLINVVGLVTGTTCIIIIFLYVSSELSYDTNFENSDRIYRIATERNYPDRVKLLASSPVPLVPSLLHSIPDVAEGTRLHKLFFQNEVTLQIEEKKFNEKRFMFADDHFFKIFNHHFLHGEPKTALREPTSVVLTESTARKYFGRTDVLGEIIKFDTISLTVSGIITDLPPNTHVHFDLLGSIEIINDIRQATKVDNWTFFWVYSFVKIRAGADADELAKTIRKQTDGAAAASLARYYGNDFAKNGHSLKFFLQPLEDIHLHSNLDAEAEPNSTITFINALICIAMVVLAISIINYINLATAKASEKAKDAGIRKTLGADSKSIQAQVFIEAAVICVFSFVVSALITSASWPLFLQLVGRTITISQIITPIYLVYALCFLALLIFITGLFPALLLSRLEPAQVLKGEFAGGAGGVKVRNGLMLAQFIITVAMITGSLAIHRHINYLEHKSLGFTPGNIIVVKRGERLGNNKQAFIDKIQATQGFDNAGMAFAAPGSFLGSTVFKNAQNSQESEVRVNTLAVDYDYIETIGFQMTQGRSYSKHFADSNTVILNRTAVKALGLSEPVGSIITNPANPEAPALTVIGVVEDFHFYSLHNPITPLVIFRNSSLAAPIIAVRTTDRITNGAIQTLKEIWRPLTDEPFEYSVLTNDLAVLYQSDQTTSITFSIFTVMAILMTCIGLMGLTSYLAQRRLKEMCIRKVLGASTLNVFFVFAKPFVSKALIAVSAAFPISYFLIRRWLENYAYKEPVSVTVFASAALISGVVLLSTIGLQFARFSKIETAKLLKENG